jgi:hypothetical protein
LNAWAVVARFGLIGDLIVELIGGFIYSLAFQAWKLDDGSFAAPIANKNRFCNGAGFCISHFGTRPKGWKTLYTWERNANSQLM